MRSQAPIDLEHLPPPGLLKQANCWTQAVKEFDAHERRYLVIVKSLHVRVLADAWYMAILRPIGQGITNLAWVVFAGGWLLQGKRFGHVLVTCKPPGCACSYEPPQDSNPMWFPPRKFAGRWKAWRKECTCINNLLFPKDRT